MPGHYSSALRTIVKCSRRPVLPPVSVHPPEPFRAYLDTAFRYAFLQGPDRVRSRQDALCCGLNCGSLAHRIIRDLFGYVLPATYQYTELSIDQEHFTALPCRRPA